MKELLENKHYEILTENEDFIAINKLAGEAVHASAHIGNAPVILQNLRDQIGQRLYPVHRLDQPTSGVLVFAKSSEAASVLAEQIRENQWQKEYHCICRGWMEESLVCEKPLKKLNGKDPKEALTTFESVQKWLLPYGNDRFPQTRVQKIKAFPKTGIYHQIRRHLNHLNFPIVGDRMHGDNKFNHLLKEKSEVEGLMLHAKRLSFDWRKKRIEIEAPYPNSFIELEKFLDQQHMDRPDANPKR